MKSPRRVLIIKTGFSEFLDRGVSTVVSLGDVLVCTMLLHLYKNDCVTWVVSSAAKELLRDNPYIDQRIVFGSKAFDQIRKKHYDVFINLEKDIGICAFLKDTKAREKYGFYFNDKRHDIDVYRSPTRLLLAGQENHRSVNNNIAEILYQAVGARWKGERPVLVERSRKKETHDIGFNYEVGSKWPTKAWPMRRWKALEKELSGDFSVSWQRGHKNLRQYIHWINSCRMIITSDSLGQIIGQALGKKVVVLFGPTNHKRMKRMPCTNVVASSLVCPYRPCFMPVCRNKKFCMDAISPREVAARVREGMRQ